MSARAPEQVFGMDNVARRAARRRRPSDPVRGPKQSVSRETRSNTEDHGNQRYRSGARPASRNMEHNTHSDTDRNADARSATRIHPQSQ